ncbi:MogA/MoaB family molybdenum cofactor biosynthesis protein [Sutcliffiella halmapala]|uniref:MogA/MoaB family molybdenum cofactor biosynthesis protein n=1 Tax=Sutcliffiella halmapala TaxID=79882 RepID=UPI00099586A6|nr:molybdopterin-binding protein [Sutcliffiella halmapala]
MLPTNQFTQIRFAVLAVSDNGTDKSESSGRTIINILQANDHIITDFKSVKCNEEEIVEQIETWCTNPTIQAIILTGGTGFTSRDVAYEAVTSILEKEMTGFGELLRFLSYGELRTSTMFSRATAGCKEARAIYALPSSTNAVKLSVEKLILPSISDFLEELLQK